ncbi:MAG: apolipoprotein N-acyltransferase [Bradymonadia bacterium]
MFGALARERWVLASLAGVFNGIGFIYLGEVSLVANVPLLFALVCSRSYWEAATLSAWVGFLGGIHIYGIINYGWFLLLGFSLYTASQMFIYGALFRFLWDGRRPIQDVLLVACIWALSEWLRTLGPICMPASYVGNIANVDWLRPLLVLSPWIGGIGVSTLIALCQSLIFHGVLSPQRHRRGLVIGAFAILIAYGVGLSRLSGADQSKGGDISVIGVQGGLANSQYHAADADPAAMEDVIKTFEKLSQDAYELQPDLVVWPETAVRADVLNTESLRSRLFPDSHHRSTLIAGLIERNQLGERFNAAIAIAPGGVTKDAYRKVRLVPSAESHLTPGQSIRPLDTSAGRVGVMICLESVYPDMARALVSNGAELLVVASNDAGFGYSPITDHMTNRAIVRAVETNRWLIRVGQAGVSAIVSPHGDVTERLGLFEPSLIRGWMKLKRDHTLYVRWGDWWMLLVLCLLAVSSIRRRGKPSV